MRAIVPRQRTFYFIASRLTRTVVQCSCPPNTALRDIVSKACRGVNHEKCQVVISVTLH